VRPRLMEAIRGVLRSALETRLPVSYETLLSRSRP
jgi:hypothetical protein